MTGKTKIVDVVMTVEYLHSKYVEGLWVKITEGGVTGYESMKAELLGERHDDNGWSACAGTKRRWDGLFIPPEEMQKVIKWFSQLSQAYLQWLESPSS